MKTSTLKQKINRLLKFLGIRIVLFKRARKPRAAAKAAYRCHVPIEDAKTCNEGRTHYVGDGCIPPHPEFETRCVKQPNSDNDVKGPTS